MRPEYEQNESEKPYQGSMGGPPMFAPSRKQETNKRRPATHARYAAPVMQAPPSNINNSQVFYSQAEAGQQKETDGKSKPGSIPSQNVQRQDHAAAAPTDPDHQNDEMYNYTNDHSINNARSGTNDRTPMMTYDQTNQQQEEISVSQEEEKASED